MSMRRNSVRTRQEAVIQGWLPQQVANGSRGHWSTHQKKLKAAQITAWAAAKQAGWQRIDGRARLEIVLVFPTKRRRDVDNLYARCKGVVDGLKEFFVDDSSEWLDLYVCAEVQAGVKETRLALEPEWQPTEAEIIAYAEGQERGNPLP